MFVKLEEAKKAMERFEGFRGFMNWVAQNAGNRRFVDTLTRILDELHAASGGQKYDYYVTTDKMCSGEVERLVTEEMGKDSVG